MNELFELCVDRGASGRTYTITCKLGLWAVSSADKEAVEREARHYWSLYFADGEYDQLLNAKTRKP